MSKSFGRIFSKKKNQPLYFIKCKHKLEECLRSWIFIFHRLLSCPEPWARFTSVLCCSIQADPAGRSSQHSRGHLGTYLIQKQSPKIHSRSPGNTNSTNTNLTPITDLSQLQRSLAERNNTKSLISDETYILW